ncbi:HNH endonuclease [Lacihabitans lacunae]|uniref:HNH endonuclease n=1 Tax=Lacihabitans lacunae TaxID=1028214 RepID=A0ABV7YVX8_9BACT
MYIFIEETPKHRANPPIYATYSQYRDILSIDFKKRCAYCNDNHNYRIRSFAIDHFVPCTPKNFTPTIPKNQYDNLIYSCSYCNRAKWDKWPTDDENKENDGSVGFLKPTNDNYKNLFFRNSNGRIIPFAGNALAIHIKDELMLWHPIHSLMWRIEKLMVLEEKVDLKLKEINNQELSNIHNKITKEITDIFRQIFSTND